MSTENPYIDVPPHDLSPRKMNPLFKEVAKCPGGRVYFSSPEDFDEAAKIAGSDIRLNLTCPGTCRGKISITIVGPIQ